MRYHVAASVTIVTYDSRQTQSECIAAYMHELRNQQHDIVVLLQLQGLSLHSCR